MSGEGLRRGDKAEPREERDMRMDIMLSTGAQPGSSLGCFGQGLAGRARRRERFCGSNE